jgi:ribosomal protein L11 methyltransferase
MPYLQLSFTIAQSQAERFEEALFEAGASSITLLDAADVPILEPLPGSTPLWPSIRLQALFDIQIDERELQQRLRTLLDDYPEAHCEVIADRLWEREWLKDFKPMRFGERLWICPGGDIPSEAASGCVIELDPGLAFGTGTHPTTALCLQWLDGARLQNHFVIDYGCGSGILAIAALKLGAAQALAVDIDPQALTATRANAIRNGVSERLLVDEVTATTHRRTSLLLANILAEPLDALADTFSRLVISGGTIVLSGLLHSQAQPLASRYSAWFDMSPAAVQGDWARLVGVRRS